MSQDAPNTNEQGDVKRHEANMLHGQHERVAGTDDYSLSESVIDAGRVNTKEHAKEHALSEDLLQMTVAQRQAWAEVADLTKKEKSAKQTFWNFVRHYDACHFVSTDGGKDWKNSKVHVNVVKGMSRASCLDAAKTAIKAAFGYNTNDKGQRPNGDTVPRPFGRNLSKLFGSDLLEGTYPWEYESLEQQLETAKTGKVQPVRVPDDVVQLLIEHDLMDGIKLRDTLARLDHMIELSVA